MRLLYDKSDLAHAKKLRDDRFNWLETLGATEISTTPLDQEGYFFGYQHGDKHYRHLVGDRPLVLDRPEHRQETACLDDVLKRLGDRAIKVPTPKTWVIGVNDDLPADLTFPLFVRTPKSSWKRGGTQARVKNFKELQDEMELLRRAFGWDTSIMARQWIEVAVAGKFMFGDAPQEVRVWIVDQKPVAWSFHYLHVVPNPRGFPPKDTELTWLAEMATRIGSAFSAHVIVADFVRDRKGKWHFLEAGTGSAAGTAHKAVFDLVAQTILGTGSRFSGDSVGGPL
jgi:hypothetical protein